MNPIVDQILVGVLIALALAYFIFRKRKCGAGCDCVPKRKGHLGKMERASRKGFSRHFASDFGQVFENTFPRSDTKWHQKAKADDAPRFPEAP